MSERGPCYEVGQANLAVSAERGPDVGPEGAGIHVDLLEQRDRVGLVGIGGGSDAAAVDAGFADRSVERTFQRQPDRGGAVVNLHRDVRRPLVPELEGTGLDAAQQVDHSAVLEPNLVIEEPPELLAELPYCRLRAPGGIQPVVVDMLPPRVMLGRDVGELVDPGQQAGQLFLAGLGEQEVVERLEGATLVGAGDGLAAAEHIIEQFALAARPAGDLLP